MSRDTECRVIRRFGTTVRQVREGREMTMDDLAATTGLSKASISTIENGVTDPRLSTIMRLAEGLRLPWWSLLGHSCGQYGDGLPYPEDGR